MKKVQLEAWSTFDKMCLISTMCKLKQTIGDQNWVAISRHTRQLNETIGLLIDTEKRSDDWFSVRQCAAQYEHLIKGTGTRKKKRSERSDSDNLESLEATLRHELKGEMEQSLSQTQAEYLKIKDILDELDSDLIDDGRLEELLLDCGDFIKECDEIQSQGIDIKSKLKTMLDEKNAENENANKVLASEPAAPPPPSLPPPSLPPPPVPEAKTSSTTSPLLTSLLQSPSPLVRSTLPSTSSPTISLLLHSSPPVPITDSTLSKLLETSPTVPVPSTSAISNSLSLPSTSAQQPTHESILKNVLEDDTIIIEKLPNEKIDDGNVIVEDLTDIEHDVIESEIIIEQDSPPSKKRRIDLDLQVVEIHSEDVDETEENGGDIEETVEEIIDRVEEAIIQTVGETNLSELKDLDQELNLRQSGGAITIDDSDIEGLEIGQDQTVEVILLPPDMNPGASTILDSNAVIISGSPVKISDDTVVIDDSSVKITNDTVVINDSPIKITQDTLVIDDSSGKITDDTVVITDASLNISDETVVIDNSTMNISNKTLVLKETPLEIRGDTVIIGTENANQAVVLASSSGGEDIILDENAVQIAGGTVIIGEEKINSETLVIQETPIEINCETIVVDEETLKDIQLSSSKNSSDQEDEVNISSHGSPEGSNSSEDIELFNEDSITAIRESGPELRTYSGRTRTTELTVQAVTSFEIKPGTSSDDSFKTIHSQDIIDLSDNPSIPVELEVDESISGQNKTITEDAVKVASSNNDNTSILYEEKNRKGSCSSSDNQNSREYHEYDSITESEVGSEPDNKASTQDVVAVEDSSDSDIVFSDSTKNDNENRDEEKPETDISIENKSSPVSKDTPKDIALNESDSVGPSYKNVDNSEESFDKKELVIRRNTNDEEEDEDFYSVESGPSLTDKTENANKEVYDKELHELSNPSLSSDESKDTDTDNKNNPIKLDTDNKQITSVENKGDDNFLPVDISEGTSTQPEKVESKDCPRAQSPSSSSSESEEELAAPRGLATELLKDEQLKKLFGQCFVSVSPVSFEKIKNANADRSLLSPKTRENIKPKPRGRAPGKAANKPSNKVSEVKKPKPRGPRSKRVTLRSSIDSKPGSPSMSVSSSDEDRDLKAWKKSIMLVYNRLASHKFASVFMKPITDNEAPGYHDVILRPMDLSTIKRNIDSGVVRTTVQFQRDMLLMVQNAIIYNKIDTPYYKMALEMGKDMVSEMEIMVQAIGDGVPLLNFSDDEKSKSRGRLNKSSVEDLSKKRKNTSMDEGRSSKRKRTNSS